MEYSALLLRLDDVISPPSLPESRRPIPRHVYPEDIDVTATRQWLSCGHIAIQSPSNISKIALLAVRIIYPMLLELSMLLMNWISQI